MSCICGHVEEDHRLRHECEVEECLCVLYEEEDEEDEGKGGEHEETV